MLVGRIELKIGQVAGKGDIVNWSQGLGGKDVHRPGPSSPQVEPVGFRVEPERLVVLARLQLAGGDLSQGVRIDGRQAGLVGQVEPVGTRDEGVNAGQSIDHGQGVGIDDGQGIGFGRLGEAVAGQGVKAGPVRVEL